MRIALRASLLCLSLLAALSAPADALEIFGNPGLGNAGRTLYPSTNEYTSLAQGFKMGSTSYELSAVDVGLRIFDPAPTSTQLLIGLYTNDSNNPGSLIASFNTGNPSPGFVTGSPGLYRFQYTGTGLQKTLAANETYWLVVQINTVDTIFEWNYAADPDGATRTPTAGTSGSGVTYAGTRGILFNASGWADIGGQDVAFSGLRYGVTVVPEPSTYALGIAGTLVMGAVARRRGRKTASA